MSNGLAAAQSLVRDEYDIVGELGRAQDGQEAWLARECATDELVALRLTVGENAGQHAVSVVRTLSSGVPARNRSCFICSATLSDWRRYCSNCGADLSGIEVPPDGSTAGLFQEAAAQASLQNLELLGFMRRSEGGGPVYFGCERTTDRILALALRRGKAQSGVGEAYCFDVTSVLGGKTLLSGAPVPSGDTRESQGTASGQPAGELSLQMPKVCPTCGKEYDSAMRFCADDGAVLRPKATSDSMIGEVVAERYHILSKIGQGGMGTVYLAQHVRMNRRCAIKVMNRSLGQDVGAVTRFSREATNASRINDDNVAHIYDFGESPDHGIYLAMEYVEGDALSKIIAEEAPLSQPRAINLASQIAKALSAAHTEGVVHRDLTPNNIVVGRTHDQSERVKVVDFGIAKAMQEQGSELTRTGFVVGTPKYMSPEQLILEPVDARSDLYSLGCILFEMLVGAHPFGSSQGAGQTTKRLTEPPPSARASNPSISPALDEVVLRALARDPNERFQSAVELRQALENAATALLTPAPKTSWLGSLLKTATKTPETGRSHTPTPSNARPAATKPPPPVSGSSKTGGRGTGSRPDATDPRTSPRVTPPPPPVSGRRKTLPGAVPVPPEPTPSDATALFTEPPVEPLSALPAITGMSERRLAAVFFADIVGFTELSAKDLQLGMRLVSRLQRLSHEVIEEAHRGRIVKFIGDAVLAEFTNSDAGARAAIQLQSSFATEADALGTQGLLRIAVHLGEVVASDDGDLYGEGVNTASRLQHEAQPGQIVTSGEAWQQLQARGEFRFESLGERELRGIDTPVAVYVLATGAQPFTVKVAPPARPRKVVMVGALLGVVALGITAVSIFKGGQEKAPPVKQPGKVRLGAALPGGAVILANDLPVTPDSQSMFPLDSGTYAMKVMVAGYEPGVGTLNIKWDEVVDWSPKLVRLPPPRSPSQMRLGTPLPPGAIVWANDAIVRPGAGGILTLDSGAYVLRIAARSYHDVTTTVILRPGLVTAWDPKFVPRVEPPLVRPSLVRLLTPLPQGTVIQSNNTVVTLDSRRTFALESGTHVLQVTADGYRVFHDTLRLKAGAPFDWRPVLDPLPLPRILVASEIPAGAVIQADERTVSLDSEKMFQLTPGTHALSIKATGFQPLDTTVSVKRGELFTWAARLIPVTIPPKDSLPTRENPPPANASFADFVNWEIRRLERDLEARNLQALRGRMTGDLIADLQAALGQAPASRIDAATRPPTLDATRMKAVFHLRIVEAETRRAMLLDWITLEASFERIPSGWRLTYIDRRP